MLTVLGLVVAALGVLVVVVRPAEPSLPESLAACQTNDCVVEILLAALEERPPQEVLTSYASTEPNSGGNIDCHDATHRLGEAAWRAMRFDAWVGSGNVCNFGYYHGFMVGAAQDADIEAFVALAERLCVTDALPEGDLPGAECLHGFGHAVFHLTDSVTAAVERCDAFASLGDQFRRRCNEGVAKDSLITKPDVTQEDFQRCATWPAGDQGTCVYVTAAYAVVRAAALDTVKSVCAPIGDADLLRECHDGLGRGVSMRAVGQRFREPGQWAEKVCGSMTECAFGFGKSVYFIRNDVDWSLTQCAVFSAEQLERCRDGVRRTATG